MPFEKFNLVDEFIVTGWFYSCLVSFKRCWLEVAFTLFFNVTRVVAVLESQLFFFSVYVLAT